jgi:hypothetical protein
METFERCIYLMKFVVSSFRHFEHLVSWQFARFWKEVKRIIEHGIVNSTFLWKPNGDKEFTWYTPRWKFVGNILGKLSS